MNLRLLLFLFVVAAVPVSAKTAAEDRGMFIFVDFSSYIAPWEQGQGGYAGVTDVGVGYFFSKYLGASASLSFWPEHDPERWDLTDGTRSNFSASESTSISLAAEVKYPLVWNFGLFVRVGLHMSAIDYQHRIWMTPENSDVTTNDTIHQSGSLISFGIAYKYQEAGIRLFLTQRNGDYLTTEEIQRQYPWPTYGGIGIGLTYEF